MFLSLFSSLRVHEAPFLLYLAVFFSSLRSSVNCQSKIKPPEIGRLKAFGWMAVGIDIFQSFRNNTLMTLFYTFPLNNNTFFSYLTLSTLHLTLGHSSASSNSGLCTTLWHHLTKPKSSYYIILNSSFFSGYVSYLTWFVFFFMRSSTMRKTTNCFICYDYHKRGSYHFVQFSFSTKKIYKSKPHYESYISSLSNSICLRLGMGTFS